VSTSGFISSEVRDYLQRFGAREHPALKACRERTTAMGDIARMQISPEQGAVMQVLARAANARRAVEVGVFTGYSSTAVALVMQAMHGADAELHALDLSAEYMALARQAWTEAGVAEVVRPRLGPAAETLDQLIAEGGAGTFDLAFIDADKTGYDAYYERCLTLLRPGGLLLIDNMLWHGDVVDPANNEPDTVALRALAAKIHADERVEVSLASVGDGLSILARR